MRLTIFALFVDVAYLHNLFKTKILVISCTFFLIFCKLHMFGMSSPKIMFLSYVCPF